MRPPRRRARLRHPRRPFLLEALECRETISDTVLGPGVLAATLPLAERLAPLAAPLPPPFHCLA